MYEGWRSNSKQVVIWRIGLNRILFLSLSLNACLFPWEAVVCNDCIAGSGISTTRLPNRCGQF